ncbi:MAG: peptide-methionine (S)-S-oxide reductase MsrA [Actinomycetales bacterium]|nr:peptide-methionine (S)-S-oxide reductase MsrA [Actinomycetales bacterium]
MTSFVLGGGCFWCLDSTFMQFKGVSDVEVGYSGGALPNPSYEAVCNGNTGHAEVAKVIFDENEIPASVILDMFFTLHDPTQLNRQGADVGTQYRSCMFYTDEEQREQFEAARDRAMAIWGPGIVTEIAPLANYFVGEEYHQDFFAKNPGQGYCNAVVAPKMSKTRKAFTQYVR